ncbi:MAG: phosphoesterase PA-phosphatase, partial [Chitinophagaceae bacterium]
MLLNKPITFCLAAIIFLSCNKVDSSKAFFSNPILYNQTVKRLNDVVLQNNFPPVIASRNYVYANIAAYECLAAGDSSYLSLSGQIIHLPLMPKPKNVDAINYQLAALLAFIKVGNAVTFPEGSLMDYYQSLLNMADSVGMNEVEKLNTQQFADTVAAVILKWSKADNYAKTRSAEKYNVVFDNPSRWIPTPTMYASALEPHWSEIRSMTLDSASQFKP